MFEELEIDGLDFLADDDVTQQNRKLDFKEGNQRINDEFYNYSRRQSSEIYSELSNLSEEELSQRLDIDSIVSYNNELRKQNEFQKEYGLEESDANEYQKKVRENFRDYLILRNISGKQKGLFYHNIIPLDKIQDSGKTVEVYDDLNIKDKLDSEKSTIIVHKTNEDDVDVIEVLCSCGKRTFIKLDYEAVDSAVIYSEGEHYPTFDDNIETYDEEEKDNQGFEENIFNADKVEPIIEDFNFGESFDSEITEDFSYEEFTKE
jgi:hypothetical protein